MGEAEKKTLLLILSLAASASVFQGAGAGSATAFVGSITLSGSEYVAAMKVGTPSQQVGLTLDTQAQLTTIARSSFDYTKSSTYRALPGELPTDVLTLSSTDGLAPTSAVQLSRIAFKLEGKTKNVLALGSGATAFPKLVSATANVAWRFAYCLSGSSSPSPIFFGDTRYHFYSGIHGSALDVTPYLKYTPLTPPPHKHGYGVEIVSITVDPFNGGVAAQVKDVAAIGTDSRYTSIVEPAYSQIREAFLRTPVVAGSFKRVKAQYGPLDLCYNFTGNFGLLRAVPFISFNFRGNTSVLVGAENYLVEAGGAGTGIYCFALTSAGKGRGRSVIGTFQQQDNVVEYDLQKQRVGMTGNLVGLKSNCGNFNFGAKESAIELMKQI